MPLEQSGTVNGEFVDQLAATITSHTQDTSAAFLVGACTGALAFKLTDKFDRLVGSDYCAQFVNTCIELQKGTPLSTTSFVVPVESHFLIRCTMLPLSPTGKTITLQDSTVVSVAADARPERAVFKQVCLTLILCDIRYRSCFLNSCGGLLLRT